MDISQELRKITQTVRGYQTPPAVIDAVDGLTILVAHLSDRIMALENKSCCKDDNSGTDVSVPKVQENVRDESGDETVPEPKLSKPTTKKSNPNPKGSKSKKE